MVLRGRREPSTSVGGAEDEEGADRWRREELPPRREAASKFGGRGGGKVAASRPAAGRLDAPPPGRGAATSCPGENMPRKSMKSPMRAAISPSLQGASRPTAPLRLSGEGCWPPLDAKWDSRLERARGGGRRGKGGGEGGGALEEGEGLGTEGGGGEEDVEDEEVTTRFLEWEEEELEVEGELEDCITGTDGRGCVPDRQSRKEKGLREGGRSKENIEIKVAAKLGLWTSKMGLAVRGRASCNSAR